MVKQCLPGDKKWRICGVWSLQDGRRSITAMQSRGFFFFHLQLKICMVCTRYLRGTSVHARKPRAFVRNIQKLIVWSKGTWISCLLRRKLNTLLVEDFFLKESKKGIDEYGRF
jgi:hypothetical protein